MGEPPEQNEQIQSLQADALQEARDQWRGRMLHCGSTCLHGVVVTVIVKHRGILR